MARFVHIEVPTQHGGVTRIANGFAALASFNITRTVLHGLALVGSPVTRLAAKARSGLAAFAAARKQRAEDEKLWNLALTDARIMADLSRAMSRDALRDTRGYF